SLSLPAPLLLRGSALGFLLFLFSTIHASAVTAFNHNTITGPVLCAYSSANSPPNTINHARRDGRANTSCQPSVVTSTSAANSVYIRASCDAHHSSGFAAASSAPNTPERASNNTRPNRYASAMVITPKT